MYYVFIFNIYLMLCKYWLPNNWLKFSNWEFCIKNIFFVFNICIISKIALIIVTVKIWLTVEKNWLRRRREGGILGSIREQIDLKNKKYVLKTIQSWNVDLGSWHIIVLLTRLKYHSGYYFFRLVLYLWVRTFNLKVLFAVLIHTIQLMKH